MKAGVSKPPHPNRKQIHLLPSRIPSAAEICRTTSPDFAVGPCLPIVRHPRSLRLSLFSFFSAPRDRDSAGQLPRAGLYCPSSSTASNMATTFSTGVSTANRSCASTIWNYRTKAGPSAVWASRFSRSGRVRRHAAWRFVFEAGHLRHDDQQKK